MDTNKQYLKIAAEAAEAAGEVFKKHFGNPAKVEIKGSNPRDFVTEVDRNIERLLRAKIGKRFPHHKIIGEEFGAATIGKKDLVWIFDPIDGTTNFIQGIPVCCISIALWDNKGPLLALTYNPILDEAFHAIRGNGAFCNRKPIHVSKHAKLVQAYGGFGWGRDVARAAIDFPKLINKLNKVRTLGSTTSELGAVAKGSYDFHIQTKTSVWDFAAAALLVTEAGGKITDWQGKPVGLDTKQIVASNGKLHSQLLRLAKTL